MTSSSWAEILKKPSIKNENNKKKCLFFIKDNFTQSDAISRNAVAFSAVSEIS
jgi:hypothetical protein